VKATSTSAGLRIGEWRRRPFLWVGGASLALALGVGLGARAPSAGLVGQLGMESVAAQDFGVLVLHPDDCASAWRFLELLARPTVRTRFPIGAIITTARPSGAQWRDRLPGPLQNAPVYPLTRKAALALGPLGLQGVPTLLVFRNQLLVSIERAPRDALEFVELGRRLDPTLNR
jgi:hypothetical protein